MQISKSEKKNYCPPPPPPPLPNPGDAPVMYEFKIIISLIYIIQMNLTLLQITNTIFWVKSIISDMNSRVTCM